MTARRSGLPRLSPSLGPRRQRHPRKCSITRLGPPGLRMCHRVAQEPAAAVPPRQVPVIRSNSEAHAWLKLKKRGRKLALRVLTFPTFRQHVSPREIQSFVVLRIECSAFRHEDPGMFQETRNQKPVVISFKVLNPNRQMNRRSTVGFSPCGGAATGQGRYVNSATVRCPQDGRGRRHLGARRLQRERGRRRGHGEARRDLISARLERLHQALDVASETGQIPAVRLERVAALVIEDPKLR